MRRRRPRPRLGSRSMAIAKVEPLLTTRNVSGPFDYRLPEAMSEVEVGSVLVVPFGRRRVVGVVVGLADRSDLPQDRLAEPLEALEAGVPPELVELGRWVGEEYCSTTAPRPRPGAAARRRNGGRGAPRPAAGRARGARRPRRGSRRSPAASGSGCDRRAVLRALAAGPKARPAGSPRAPARTGRPCAGSRPAGWSRPGRWSAAAGTPLPGSARCARASS